MYDGSRETPDLSASGDNAAKVEQPKMTDFPLDHILPVFNINRIDQKHQFPGAMKKTKG